MDDERRVKPRPAPRVQRDEVFLGLHSPELPASGSGGSIATLDLYGTLQGKKWKADCEWLVAALWESLDMLLKVAPGDADTTPRIPGVHPVPWTYGHVAFTTESIICETHSWPSRQPPWDKASETPPRPSWTIYDSMRVSGAERWEMYEAGTLPDADTARRYLYQVHEDIKLM